MDEITRRGKVLQSNFSADRAELVRLAIQSYVTGPGLN